MNIWIKLIIGLIALLVWIAAIVSKHFWNDLEVGGLITAAMATLVGLGVYHISDPSTTTTTTVGDITERVTGLVAPKQDGYASVRLLALLAAVCSVLVVGCAGLNVSWTASYNMPQIAVQVNPGAVAPVTAEPKKP